MRRVHRPTRGQTLMLSVVHMQGVVISLCLFLPPSETDFSVIWFPWCLAVFSQQVFYRLTPLLSTLSVGFHYQIPLPTISARLPLSSLFSGLFLLMYKSRWMQPRAPLPCRFSVTPLVHWKGCASELTQSCFIQGFHGQLRELHENWDAFFLHRTITPFALFLMLLHAALILLEYMCNSVRCWSRYIQF